MPRVQVSDSSYFKELGSSTTGDATMMPCNEEENQSEEVTVNSAIDRILIR